MTLDSQLPGEIEPNLWWRRSPHFAAVLQVCHRCWHVDQVRRWLVDQVRCWHVDQVHRWHVDHTLWCQWWHRHWRLVPFHANAQYFILLRSSPVLYILSATKCHHCSLEYYQYSLTTDQLNQYLMCNVDQCWLLYIDWYILARLPCLEKFHSTIAEHLCLSKSKYYPYTYRPRGDHLDIFSFARLGSLNNLSTNCTNLMSWSCDCWWKKIFFASNFPPTTFQCCIVSQKRNVGRFCRWF